MSKNFEDMNFEDAMDKLERIVNELDKGEAPLDESLSLFEEGVKLTKFCTEKIESARQKVKILTDGEETEFTFKEKSGE